MKQTISTRLTINGEQVTNVFIAGNIEAKTKDILVESLFSDKISRRNKTYFLDRNAELTH